MALIGSIAIDMGVNLAKLTKGLGAAQKDLGRFEVSVGGIGAALSKGLAVAGIGYATAKLAGFVRESLNTADAANDAAQAIGTTAGELSGLRYVAKLTGTETESLDAGLKKMAVNLGDAARQGGPTAKSLAELGLNARELAAMDPSQAFLKIAGAISQVKNPALQASYAVDIFGKAGVNLMNTLRAGPEQLGRLAAEAKSLGLAISEDDVAKIGAANDALDRLGYAFQGLGNLIAANVAPALTETIEGMVRWATEGDRLANIIKAAFDRVTTAVRWTRAVVENLGPALEIVNLQAQQWGANAGAVFAAFGENVSRVFSYVATNWQTLLTGMLKALAMWGLNALKGIKSVFTAVYDLASGKDVQEVFQDFSKNALASFGIEFEKFPEMVSPVLNDFSDQIAAAQARFTGGVIDSFDRLSKEAANISHAAGKAAPGELPGGDRTTKLASLAEAGSKEAYAVLSRNSRGGSGPIDKVAANTAKQVDLQKQTLDALKSGGKAGALPVFAMS